MSHVTWCLFLTKEPNERITHNLDSLTSKCLERPAGQTRMLPSQVLVPPTRPRPAEVAAVMVRTGLTQHVMSVAKESAPGLVFVLPLNIFSHSCSACLLVVLIASVSVI
ncbi:hypothetical protein ElyMa_000594200 [Elysia marginata]|uniref:Uncharacterized protein n=1 Tax=Elysia marginata TaxID=1093978 RepID=A0AAV4G5K6_9GAST|nr:hypothetical protein ElyMa_000594200 [Elysia marginata]